MASKSSSTGSRAFSRAVWALGMLAIGFLAGWLSGSRLSIGVNAATQRDYLADRGDASPATRAAVLASLQEFQAGYRARDAARLDAFMQSLFPRTAPVLLAGTDVGEWRTGYQPVRTFIASDWRNWGDLRLDVPRAAVSSYGDVAWLATTGSVRMTHSSRPIRFTAVLTRQGDKWLFRQLQFQWDDRPARLSDLSFPGDFSSLCVR